ncbi:hypothetical protein [Sphingobium yanoikuyae]|uniref:hypothetical protein n=1 Tax=Sphingobium yanoikuyae TaxID=13690 RepID=UPI0028AFB3FB|nr:hypothetical protein [Sphingobium yanoikuyae]
MQTNGNTDADAESGLATVPRWAALPIIIAGGVGAIAAGQFSSLAVAQGIGLTVVMTIFTAWLWRPLHRFRIAWIVTGTVLIVHLLLVFTIPWPHQDRASKVVLLIMLVDIFAVIIASDRLERYTRARRNNLASDVG